MFKSSQFSNPSRSRSSQRDDLQGWRPALSAVEGNLLFNLPTSAIKLRGRAWLQPCRKSTAPTPRAGQAQRYLLPRAARKNAGGARGRGRQARLYHADLSVSGHNACPSEGQWRARKVARRSSQRRSLELRWTISACISLVTVETVRAKKKSSRNSSGISFAATPPVFTLIT
jgi:hypothetical protein